MIATEVAYIWSAEQQESVTCPICGTVSDELPIWLHHFQHVSETHPSHWQKISEELGLTT